MLNFTNSKQLPHIMTKTTHFKYVVLLFLVPQAVITSADLTLHTLTIVVNESQYRKRLSLLQEIVRFVSEKQNKMVTIPQAVITSAGIKNF